MSKKKFWSWSNSIESTDSELVIEGDISSESWWGDEATPAELRKELAKHKGDLTVSLNSNGGDVFAGVSMYNALKNFDGNVTVRVDGLAASIASVIAMAGDKVIMSPGSMMMIHKPWTVVAGDANELDKVKEVLNEIEGSLLPIYISRTGKSEEEVRQLLDAETWMTAEEAVEMGFADEAIEAKKSSYSDAIKNLLNGNLAFSMKATEESMKQLFEKIQASEQEEATAESDEEKEVEETDVTDTTEEETTDDVKSEEVSTDVEETEVTEEVADESEVATEKVNNSDKKEVKMSKQDEIAVDNIQAAVPTQEVKETVSVKDYLNTKEAMGAFARILEENAVSGSASELAGNGASDSVRSAWKNHLEVKLGVTNPEIFLPTPLIQEIEDAFKSGGEIWQRVSKTGMDSFNAAWDAATDPSAEAGRAKGYNRSVEANKEEQVLTFANRILRPQFVYKYITLNKEDVKEQRSTGALVRFVLSELPRRIIREIERAIVLGDGRGSGADQKIQEGNPRGFYPIVSDAQANNTFASLYTPAGGEDNYAAVVKANDLLEAEGTRVLIAKKGYVTDMKLATNANGGYIFPLGADFASILGVDAVIEPDWFTDTTEPDVDAVLVVLSNYRVVGDQSIEAFQNFILKTNKNEYLQEIYAGGGLTFRKTAVAIGTDASS